MDKNLIVQIRKNPLEKKSLQKYRQINPKIKEHGNWFCLKSVLQINISFKIVEKKIAKKPPKIFKDCTGEFLSKNLI